VSQQTERDALIYGGVCPVCGDEFSDGWSRLEGMDGETIENVKICVVEFPDTALFHLPDDDE